MKFRIQQEPFAEALSLASRSTAARSTLPVLSGILLVAQDHELHLAATDLETGIQLSLPAQVERPGRVVLPARQLTELIRRFRSGEVTLEKATDRPNVTIWWRRSEFTLNGLPAEQFPQRPTFQPTDAVRFVQGALKDALQRTVFAVSQEEVRPVLTGVSLTIASDGRVEALATDGKKIAHRKAADFPLDGVKLVVPGRTLGELIKLLAPGDEEGLMKVTDNQIVLQLGELLFHSRLLDGNYPDVLQMLPSEYQVQAVVNRLEFQDAVERVALLAESSDRISRSVRVQVDQNGITLLAQTADLGEGTDFVEAEVSGPALELSFNVRLLLEGLRHFVGDRLVVAFATGQKMFGRMTDPSDPHFVYTVLPLRA